jgi:hypothetical protein
MTIFENDAHPRIADGTFTEKAQTAPQVALRGPRVFSPGDQLPDLGSGSWVEADGDSAFRVATSANPFQPRHEWVTGSGRLQRLSECRVSVVRAPETDADGYQSRPAGSLRHGDQVYYDGSDELMGEVQSVVYDGERSGHVRVAIDSDTPGLFCVSVDDTFRVKTPGYTYSPAGDRWENVQATKSPTLTADELSSIIGRESDDDFMVAAIGNSSATADIVHRASRIRSLRVRRAAVFSTAVSRETLTRIGIDAAAAARGARNAAEYQGEGLEADRYLRNAGEHDRLELAVRQELARRTAA